MIISKQEDNGKVIKKAVQDVKNNYETDCDSESEEVNVKIKMKHHSWNVIYTDPTKYVIGLKHGEENLAHKVISLIQICNDIDTLKSKISLLISSFSSPSRAELF